MDTSCSYLQHINYISSPITRPLPILFKTRLQHAPNDKRRQICLVSSRSDARVAGNKAREAVVSKESEIPDLKTWMHENGLPPCRVELKDRPCPHNSKLRPIHYVAASEDLEVFVLFC